jgi:archaellum component FlaG (FlaF/FlaG flagellin family)
MTAREQQAKNMATAILKHGKKISFSSNTYKPQVDQTDGSYSLLVQFYIKQLGGDVVDLANDSAEVVVRVHETDDITATAGIIIFDPWRTYPNANNVVYYGK